MRSPRPLARKHSAALSLSVRSVRRVLHRNLKFHPRKLMVAQELPERDHETHVSCFQDILQNVPASAVLITSDKTHFHLSTFVNKQNFRY